MDNLTFDERRLLRLLEDMRPKLVRKANLWGGKFVVAEDLAQDAIAKTWANRAGLSSVESYVKSYLYTSLKRLITDVFRYRKSRPTIHPDSIMSKVEADTFTEWENGQALNLEMPDEKFTGLVNGWALSEDLKTMGMTDKENAIVMLRVAGMTFGETAEVLNLTEPAVKSAFLRFRRKAVKHLGAEYGITED